jgi:BirA family transcriptional regulator, biotin operon repressor / biotin---[acetyl-CoA-carboxylase] ligase
VLPPRLDVALLRRELVEAGLWRELRVVPVTGSTNADVAVLAKSGELPGLVLIAEHQAAGRGRLDRVWTAPPRSGLSFSVLLRPAGLPVAAWRLLPLLVGVSVATAVRSATGIEVGLKWPNDLLIGERKLGGILAERVEAPDGAAVVVGVGLNVGLRESELPVPTATSLVLAGAGEVDRTAILGAILRVLADEYARWQAAAGHGVRLLGLYRELCVTLGRDVRVELAGGQTIEGRAVDVEPDGSLIVESAQNRRSISAGDVVHVR